jgi:hypothetical protein
MALISSGHVRIASTVCAGDHAHGKAWIAEVTGRHDAPHGREGAQRIGLNELALLNKLSGLKRSRL